MSAQRTFRHVSRTAVSPRLTLRSASALAALLACLAGCSSPAEEAPVATRTVQGKLSIDQYLSLARPGMIAQTADGTTFDGPVTADGAFRMVLPTGTPIRLFIADVSVTGRAPATSKVLWPGGAEWVKLAPADATSSSDGVSTGGGAGATGPVAAGSATTPVAGETATGGGAGATAGSRGHHQGVIDIGSIRPVADGAIANTVVIGAGGGGASPTGTTDSNETHDGARGNGSGHGSGSGSGGGSSGSGSGGDSSSGGGGSGSSGGSGGSGKTADGEGSGTRSGSDGETSTGSSASGRSVCAPKVQGTSRACGTRAIGSQSADLPYDAKLPVGWTYQLSDSFLEKGPLPAAILDVKMDGGGTWRLAELKANAPFVVTDRDCAHAGNRDTGRDRAIVTWRDADGSTQTDHIDMRYCLNDPPPHSAGLSVAPAPAPNASSPIADAAAPSNASSLIGGCETR